jgi:hypothetical protein
MAYSGSTAGTTSRNPARLISEGGMYGRSGGVNGTTSLTSAPAEPNAQGGRLWAYVSTNKTTDMNAASNTFFADGDDLGMAPGDVVMAVQFTSAASSAILSFHVVTQVSTGGAGLSTGGIISSTYS